MMARRQAEKEAEMERLEEANLAEELRVIDLTRFGECYDWIARFVSFIMRQVEKEAEMERLEEANLAEELCVIDLTRFGECLD